jgi:type II secretory pathway pseudopilin PulG
MRTSLPARRSVAAPRSVSVPLLALRSRARRSRPTPLPRAGDPPPRTPPVSEGGFALVELLVACAVAGIVFTATLVLLVSGQQIQARDSEWALTLQEGRAGLGRMLRDIRQASKVEEAKAGSILFLATISGKSWTIKYECGVSQAGTAYTECVRFAAEEGKALPSSGSAIVRDVLNGSEVFSYSPSAAAPTIARVKIEIPAKGTLKPATGSGYKHRVVLEDAAFMRNLDLTG